MKALVLAACVALAGCAGMAHEHSPYAGQQARGIKALSKQDVAGYESGAGMGLAKPAELNGFPGPMHSLENANELSLTPAQQATLESLLRRHKDEARRLGAEVVRLEAELDALFSRRVATAESVDAKVRQIAAVQASLRASHLKAHLETTAVLTGEQVERYNKARGYQER